jgi:hypothetical protein
MTAKSMRRTDLRRWNLIQIALMEGLGVAIEPANVLAFGKWFADEVDRLRRLPRYSEVELARSYFL